MSVAILKHIPILGILRVLLILAFIGLVTVSAFQLMGKTIFPKTEDTKQVEYQQSLFLPVLFLP